MNRRQFLAQLSLIAAGTILLPTDGQLRRFWALDRTMIYPKSLYYPNSLSRPGVVFSKDQMAEIRLRINNGNIIGAQRMILEELAKEFKASYYSLIGPVQVDIAH